MITLTPPQLALLLHIQAGRTKTRDLSAALGYRSVNTVDYHKRQLQAKELVTWQPKRAATLEVTEAGQALLTSLGYVKTPGGHVGFWEEVAPLIEKEPVFCTADEYEEMVS